MNKEIECPFCGEKGFDKIGLKYHLEIYCEEYKNASTLGKYNHEGDKS